MSNDPIARSRRYLATGRVAAGLRDFDSAADRAYYAMYHAAREVLIAIDREKTLAIRKHSTLISQFGLLLVQTGLVDAKLGRWLNRAEQTRLRADYGDPGSVAEEEAQELLLNAEAFVDAMEAFLARTDP
jgi:uncharacterized protein (UPF0332 family)